VNILSPRPMPAPEPVATPEAAVRPHWVRRQLQWCVSVLLGKLATLILALLALLLGIATFALLAWGLPGPNQVVGLVLANLIVLLILGAVLAARLTRVILERRRGAAGAQLHIKLVLLLGGVAVTPAIVVAVFSTVFFNLGIQAWFADPVRVAIEDSLQVARGYAEEHRNNIRADALAMANDLSRGGLALFTTDPAGFANFLGVQTGLRGLTEAVIFEPVTGQVLASAGPLASLDDARPPQWAIETAHSGDVAVLGSDNQTQVRAVVMLQSTPTLMLVIGRLVDPSILDHITATERAVTVYKQLDANRSGLQVTFAVIFALVALLVLAAAVLVGLVLANQIARPVGQLIFAAERVRGGDLDVRVPERQEGDEIAGLSRAFNRMTGQLGAQRAELMEAYRQIDERRRFTEAVLSGVSAGVIGLDINSCIDLPNRAAATLLGRDLLGAIGRPLAEVVPEFAPLLAEAQAAPWRPHTAEVQLGPSARGGPGERGRRVLLLRIGADRLGPRDEEEAPPDDADAASRFHFVATFDDITELLSAQRKAAWADVARRIAHEIKNPLTPIQLAAERLKRRFAREITSDPETFSQCADTIIRHVGDIGRMVDEFSAFARMPQPVIRTEDVGRVVRDALVLYRSAHSDIAWTIDIPATGPMAPCDRRQIGQALTNLLQNATDAMTMHQPPGDGAAATRGRIEIAVRVQGDAVSISVADDGCGLPGEDRSRLTEPYVTHKPKGTGLGLAIVKKIMEDHGGRIELEDRVARPDWPGGGAVATLVLPGAADERVG
jgi:two-component system nitrogen regulation sensor histidine kinase NtrY